MKSTFKHQQRKKISLTEVIKNSGISHSQNLTKICPASKKCRDKDGAMIEETANQQLALLETQPMGEHQPLTILLLCCAYRQEPTITPLRGFPEQPMETDAETHNQTF